MPVRAMPGAGSEVRVQVSQDESAGGKAPGFTIVQARRGLQQGGSWPVSRRARDEPRIRTRPHRRGERRRRALIRRGRAGRVGAHFSRAHTLALRLHVDHRTTDIEEFILERETVLQFNVVAPPDRQDRRQYAEAKCSGNKGNQDRDAHDGTLGRSVRDASSTRKIKTAFPWYAMRNRTGTATDRSMAPERLPAAASSVPG